MERIGVICAAVVMGGAFLGWGVGAPRVAEAAPTPRHRPSGRKAGKHKAPPGRRKRTRHRPLKFREIRHLGGGRYAMSLRTKTYFLEPLSYVKLKVLIEPKVRGGRAIGYSLLYVSTASPLRRMGFREKDVIVSVNGRRVYSSYSALVAYLALKKERSYTVKLLRGQKMRTLSFSIR